LLTTDLIFIFRAFGEQVVPDDKPEPAHYK